MDNKAEARKQKLAYFWTIVTLIASIIIGAGVIMQSSVLLPVVLAAIAICFGPVCGILYLMEIKKGVLSVEEEEE